MTAGRIVLVAVLALVVVPQRVAPFSVPLGNTVREARGSPPRPRPSCGTAARRSLAAPCTRWHPAPATALRMADYQYPNLDFDFESAAEDSVDDDADTEKLHDRMMTTLREEAMQYLDVPMLRAQMQKHVLSRYSLSEIIASILASKICSPDLSEAQVFEVLVSVMRAHPQLQVNAIKDLEWCREIDPATVGFLQPLLYFKGVQAVLLQRIAHRLWVNGEQGKKMMALALQGRGSEVFGVDAHPGAVIKHAVMLDHATGVVIGETATIGYKCYILHSITLGSTGKGDRFDRHPKIGNRVKIGAGAKVLGNVRIDNDAFIGAGAIVTVNVKEGETVVGINRVLDTATKKANVNEQNQDTWLYTI